MKIVLHDDHGGEHDVTEHVRSLYGHTVGSMDWGSGFLDTDEMLEVQEFGYLSGFEEQDLDKAIDSAAKEAERFRKYAEMPGRRVAYEKKVTETAKFLAGLHAIKDARARLFEQTDDVTGFDEQT